MPSFNIHINLVPIFFNTNSTANDNNDSNDNPTFSNPTETQPDNSSNNSESFSNNSIPPLFFFSINTGSGQNSSFSSFEDILNEVIRRSAEETPKAPPPASKKALDALERIKIDSQHASYECPICQESLFISEQDQDENIENNEKYQQNDSKQNLVLELPCGHLYHEDCILLWLKNTNTCPTCRYELEVDDAEYEAKRKERMSSRQNNYCKSRMMEHRSFIPSFQRHGWNLLDNSERLNYISEDLDRFEYNSELILSNSKDHFDSSSPPLLSIESRKYLSKYNEQLNQMLLCLDRIEDISWKSVRKFLILRIQSLQNTLDQVLLNNTTCQQKNDEVVDMIIDSSEDESEVDQHILEQNSMMDV